MACRHDHHAGVVIGRGNASHVSGGLNDAQVRQVAGFQHQARADGVGLDGAAAAGHVHAQVVGKAPRQPEGLEPLADGVARVPLAAGSGVGLAGPVDGDGVPRLRRDRLDERALEAHQVLLTGVVHVLDAALGKKGKVQRRLDRDEARLCQVGHLAVLRAQVKEAGGLGAHRLDLGKLGVLLKKPGLAQAVAQVDGELAGAGRPVDLAAKVAQERERLV